MPTFDIDQPGAFEEWLHQGLREAAVKGARQAAIRLVGIIQNEIIPNTQPRAPVGVSGAYRAGWRPENTEHGADVVNTVPYAPIIEGGARAENVKISRAMIDALTEWVRIKGLAGRSLGKAGRAGRAPTGDVLTEARQIAWAIAMHFKQVGIFNGGKGLRVAERATARAPALLREEVRRALAEALR